MKIFYALVNLVKVVSQFVSLISFIFFKFLLSLTSFRCSLQLLCNDKPCARCRASYWTASLQSAKRDVVTLYKAA